MDSRFTPFHRGGSGTPLLCVHGFTDTWRTWDLVLPALEREHDVLAPTLAGHAGGPLLEGEFSAATLPDALERAMDEAGLRDGAHRRELARRLPRAPARRARAGGVGRRAGPGRRLGDDGRLVHGHGRVLRRLARGARRPRRPTPTRSCRRPKGRRQATQSFATNFEHIPAELLAHMLRGVAACHGARTMLDYALRAGYELDAAKITCPVRIVWGTDDQLLAWPSAAVRFREEWLPHADWVELDGIGHCPQLDVPLETAQLILGFTAR